MTHLQKITWLTGAAIVLIIVASVAEQMQWMKYREDHHCREVSKIKGQTVSGIANGSYVSLSTSDQITYECDGGEVIVR